jgi:hypothetical protein
MRAASSVIVLFVIGSWLLPEAAGAQIPITSVDEALPKSAVPPSTDPGASFGARSTRWERPPPA